MTLHLLTDRASINAAIATMHPTAREAAQLLAHRIAENVILLDNGPAMEREWLQACAVSFARTGRNPSHDMEAFQHFVEDHGSAVMNVAVSIVYFIAKSEQRRRRWGWVGKAAAVAAGIAIGSFFG